MRPFIIGLTGSIGMGKSTTARMFAEEGVPVWDADAAVARLYAQGGAAVDRIADLRPDAVVGGAVDRERLKAWIAEDPNALGRIEAVVHPLVYEDRRRFLDETESDVVLLDIPLLLEKGGEDGVDHIVVVSAPPEVQRERVIARAGMTEAHFETILTAQMPDADKRAKADTVIPTDTLDNARAAVRRLLRHLEARRA